MNNNKFYDHTRLTFKESCEDYARWEKRSGLIFNDDPRNLKLTGKYEVRGNTCFYVAEDANGAQIRRILTVSEASETWSMLK